MFAKEPGEAPHGTRKPKVIYPNSNIPGAYHHRRRH